ncbi:hypothetical protein ACFQ4K_22515 [Tistrella bauzanensis]
MHEYILRPASTIKAAIKELVETRQPHERVTAYHEQNINSVAASRKWSGLWPKPIQRRPAAIEMLFQSEN